MADWNAEQTGGVGQRARAAVLGSAGQAISPALFRLWAGRWPTWAEAAQFAQGFRVRGLGLSVLPRAVSASPAADFQLSAILFHRLIDSGRLPALAAHGPTPQAGNPLAFWEGPPVAFLHFEKTGGSALIAALARHFHPLQVAGDDTFTGGRRGKFEVAAADIRLRRRPLLWGHFALNDLRAGAPAHLLLTVLREPRSRILSLYYFWRSIRPEHVAGLDDPRVEAAHACSLLEFLRLPDKDVRGTIDNVYVRRLGITKMGLDEDDTDAEAPADETIGRALTALKAFAWVGVTHRLDEGVARLSGLLGETLGPLSRTENTRAQNHIAWPLLYRKVETPPLTDAEEAALSRLTQLDEILFRKAELLNTRTSSAA